MEFEFTFEQLGWTEPKNKESDKPSPCLHDSCIRCNGTGIQSNGLICVHMISCKCKKCSHYC